MKDIDNLLTYSWTVIALVVAIAILIYVSRPQTQAEFGCKITDIQYRSVKPFECWNPDIRPEFCPLPKNVECWGETESVEDLKALIMGE